MGLSDICRQQHEHERHRLRRIFLWGLAGSVGVHAAAFGLGQINPWTAAEEEGSPIELIIVEADPNHPTPQPDPVLPAELGLQSNDGGSGLARGFSGATTAASPGAVLPLSNPTPGSGLPSATTPETTVAAKPSESLALETPEPASSEPELAEPESVVPKITQPAIAEPDVVEPEALESDVAEPTASEEERLADTQIESEFEEPQATAAAPTPEEDPTPEATFTPAATNTTEEIDSENATTEPTSTRRAQLRDWLQRLRGSSDDLASDDGSPGSGVAASQPSGVAQSGSAGATVTPGTGSGSSRSGTGTAGTGTGSSGSAGGDQGVATASGSGSGQGRGSRTVACQNCVRPSYPQSALDEGAEGQPRVSVDINPDGTVRSVTLTQSSGNAAIDQAAIEAARNSRFQPVAGGARVPIEYDLTIEGSRRNQDARRRGERQSVEVPAPPAATAPSSTTTSASSEPRVDPATASPAAATPSPALDSGSEAGLEAEDESRPEPVSESGSEPAVAPAPTEAPETESAPPSPAPAAESAPAPMAPAAPAPSPAPAVPVPTPPPASLPPRTPPPTPAAPAPPTVATPSAPVADPAPALAAPAETGNE